MALKLGWELEAWTLPGVGAFALVDGPLPVIEANGTDPASGHGFGSIELAAGYANLDLICDPDSNVETLIRLKVDGSYTQFAFYARFRTDNFDDNGTTLISGPTLEDMLDHAIVYPYDWPKTNDDGDAVSGMSDWYWGSENNGIRNPGFEQVPPYISNRNFDDGTIQPWRPGPLTDISVVTTAPLVGANHLLVEPSVLDAGTTFTIPVLPNGLYEIDVWVRTASGTGTIELGCTVPGDIRQPVYSVVTPNLIVGDKVVGSTAQPNNPDTGTGELNIQYGGGIEDPDHADYEGVVYVEMKADVAATTTYQLIRVALWTGKGQTSMDISVRNRDSIFDFYVDQIDVQGLMVGLTGWQVAMAWPGQPTLQAAYPLIAQSEPSDPDTGSYHAVINAKRAGQGIKQAVSGIVPGGTYTVTARIKTAVGVDARLLVTDPLGNWVPGAWDIGATGGVYTTFTATFTAPESIPGDGQTIPANDTLIVKIELDEDSVPSVTTIKVDNVKIVPGVPAATIGDILDQLLQDAAVDHVADGRVTVGGAGHLSWLVYDFDDFGDSALPTGSAWTTPANPGGLEQVTVKRGMSYLQLMEQVVERLGYEWRIIWRDSPGEWVLQVYIPGGMAVDQSGTVSLIVGAVGPSKLGKNASGNNYFLGEGGESKFVESEDTTERDAYGRREKYTANRQLAGHDSLAEWVAAVQADEVGVKESHRVELHDTSTFIPYRDFFPGDIVNVDLGASLSTRDLPVKQVSFRLSDEQASFQVDLNADPMPNSAVPVVALEKILTRFQGMDDDFKWAGSGGVLPVTGGGGAVDSGQVGGGGMVSVVVAASNASAESQAKADYVCDGTTDDVEIIQALNDLQYDNGTGSGGLVQLTEGDFYLDWNEVKLSESGIGYWQNDYAGIRGVGPATRIHPSASDVASAVRSTSVFGTVAVLIDNDVPFGVVENLAFMGQPAATSADTAYLRLASSVFSTAKDIWFNFFDDSDTGVWPYIGILADGHGNIENINLLGQGWDEVDPEYLIACDTNSRYRISGIHAYLAGDDSAHDGVTLVATSAETSIQDVFVYGSDACQVLEITSGASVSLSHVRYRSSSESATAGRAAGMYMGSTGTSRLVATDWQFDGGTALIDFAHGLTMVMTGVYALGMTMTIGVASFSSKINIDSSCDLGPIELTEGLAGRISGQITPDGTATIGVALIDCEDTWVQSARFGGGTAFTDFINVDAGCTNCVVVQNDSRGGGAITDNGTGTTLTLAGNL